MARPKKQVKLKEPIKIRLKSLADGNKSIYLDIYHTGLGNRQARFNASHYLDKEVL